MAWTAPVLKEVNCGMEIMCIRRQKMGIAGQNPTYSEGRKHEKKRLVGSEMRFLVLGSAVGGGFLGRIIQNLVSNAIRYSVNGAILVGVRHQ